MPKSLRAIYRLTVVAAASVAAMASTTGAQIAPIFLDSARHQDPCVTKPQSTGPRFTIAPYGWMTGIRGQTGVRDLSADVDVSFSDILSHLRFGAMGSFEVGYGPWRGMVDGVYASLRVDRTPALRRGNPDLDMTMKSLISQAFAGYSFKASPEFAIDLLAGTRIWDVKSSLTITGDILRASRSRNPTWVDAVGGFRLRLNPTQRWALSLTADGGGGGSRGTGEGIATVGYSLSRHWALFASYRYLYEDYTKNEFFFNGHYAGPVIGGSYRW